MFDLSKKGKFPRELWLKTTWSEPCRWVGPNPTTKASSFSRTAGSSGLRLYLPPPSSAPSSLNPSSWETSQAAASLVVSFFPPSLPGNSRAHTFNLRFPSQSGPTSPSRMSLCCWKTSGRPWRTCCSSSKVRKIRFLTNFSPDAHLLPQIAPIPISSRVLP